jgi:hypothetical protein
MNTLILPPAAIPPVPKPWRRLLTVLGLGLVVAGGGPAPVQAADAAPPNFMTYQGYLVDANSRPLASDNPANYPVVFRIYDKATSDATTKLLWTEEQIVTIDKGNFSVLLGEGNVVGTELRPPLSEVFRGTSASDRFLGITVTINGVPTEILPRLRLLPGPYAFLARAANSLVDNNGAMLVSAGTGSEIQVAGKVTAAEFAGNGAALTGLDASAISQGTLADARIPNLNASKVNAGAFAADRIPNLDAGKITTGALGDARLSGNVARRDQANTFTGEQTADGHFRVGARRDEAVSGAGYGKALIFSGAPDVSTSWNNDNSDPLWLARYNTAANQTELRMNIGDDPNVGDDRFVIGTTSGAGAEFNQSGNWTPLVTVDNRAFLGVGTSAPGWPVTVQNDALPGIAIQRSDGRYGIFYRTQTQLVLQLNLSQHNAGVRYALYDGDSNWDFGSDRRLKKDIEDVEPMLDRALQIPVRRFRWKEDAPESKHLLGVIAQEVQPLFPDLVGQFEDPQTKETTLTVGYGDFGVIAIKSIQELKTRHDAEISELKAQMAELIQANAELRRRLDAQEAAAAGR